MNPKLLAQALRQMGVANSKTDKDLVYVTPEEEAMLRAHGGSGRVDPTTGLQHYDDGDGGDDGGDDGDAGVGSDAANDAGDEGDAAAAADAAAAEDAAAADAISNAGPESPGSNFDNSSGRDSSYGEAAIGGTGPVGTSGRGDTAFGPGGELSGLAGSIGDLADALDFQNLDGTPSSGRTQAVVEQSFTPTPARVDTYAQQEAAMNAARAAAPDEDALVNANAQSSMNHGPGLTADQIANANQEYTDIYGEAPAVGAEDINGAYQSYANQYATAGNIGGLLGTTWDVVNGLGKGASYGPWGSVVTGILSGVTGRNGDRGTDLGHDIVAGSLADGTWGNNTTGADGGNGSDSAIDSSSSASAVPLTPTPHRSTSSSVFTRPQGGFTRTGYKASSPLVAALRAGPNGVMTDLDTTPLQGIRRRYYGE